MKVRTESELEAAINNNEKHITVVGEYAEELAGKLESRKKRKKAAAAGSAAALAVAVAAAPLTGGASLAGAAGFAALTVGSLTLTATELALILGAGLSACALLRDYNVKIKVNREGEAELEFDK